ncbi:DUF2199 domain-containing protein [Aquincola sp. S2]|uniref:DUF2199 domain-containing protein n=1 Tax=Pseudaquabacterium terrae TaxID=2732868 RepID=A0ABX2EV79_9BURK|nr:DUF2199 domain-containing protein [Aquabacterium terrae]NRF72449.1 DUF2199 domain-containing protein [Aquabacterium terrae]
MPAIFAFTCTCCGKLHEGSPSFAFNAPDHYANLTEEQKARIGKLNSDVCTIAHEDRTDYFIRTILEIPIEGVAEPFTWGVWVSLSKKSFERYLDTYDTPVEGEGFFGWLCNAIPNYPSGPSSRPTDVIVQLNRQRPKLLLHRGEQETDPLVIDQHQGISVARAQSLAEQAMHR